MYSRKVMTRAEMEAEYGPLPPSFVTTWTLNRSHASVTFVTDDGGDHWIKKDVIWAAEAQAHNLISAITMAIAGRGFEKAFIRISNFGIKDGVEAKVTADRRTR